MRTFFCLTSLTFEPKPDFGEQTGKCWRMGPKIRCQSRSGKTTSDVLVVGSRRTSTDRVPLHAGGSDTSGSISDARQVPISCEPWSYGLLTFYGRTTFRVTLTELLADVHRVHSVARVEVDGRALVYLDVSHDRARYEMWFDPDVNYLVRKMTFRLAGSGAEGQRSEFAVSSFKEPAPGIFFPERVEAISYKEGKRKSSSVAKFSGIQINRPLPQGIFDLKFPPGIFVSDIVQGTVSKSDENGQPTLPALDKEGKPLRLATGAIVPSADSEDSGNRVTQEEPRPWTRWLFPIALGFIGLAGALWLIKKWRRPSVAG
jgi:hypothetical protein